MSYPILYKSNETDFFAMGLGPIQMLKATVTQERNGIFIFEGEILTDNPLFPLVLENYIIKADADHLLKDQRFRIKRIVPNHDGKAQIYAEHVSYLSRELTIKPEVNITGSAQIALNQWKSSIVESNPFVVSSDITTSASTKWRIDKVENPMVALGGVEGSILERWGGEYLFDNYHISLLKKRGKTATNILAYGRNITDFEQERNILSTYTSIAPYAIYTDDNEKEIVVTVDGFVVDSEHVNKFPNRVTKPIDFSSEFGSGEIPTKARLTTLAQQYVADNEIGVPTTSIKISFLDLSQTADYAEYAFLEQVNLCDDVRVHYPKLGVNTIAKVVRVVWNCLTESYDEIEIGQKRMSLASQIQEQNKVIQEINTQTNQAQVSADGKNMIFYGLYGENGLGEPSAIKIGDSWFKPNGLETELYVWTGIEWKLIMSTSSFSEIEDTIKTLDDELEQTTTTANDAVNKAEQAIIDAGFANSAIEVADGKISSLEQNLDGFQQVVQNTYADKTTVTALATQWTQTTELANGHTSAINSLGEQLNLRVAKSELISQINISPETILIASNKIQIKGNTYIEYGVIKNAHIADLAVNGAKIANASIGSAKIISLDASKLTAGTITAINYENPFTYVDSLGTVTGTTYITNGGFNMTGTDNTGAARKILLAPGMMNTQIGNAKTNVKAGRIEMTSTEGGNGLIFYSPVRGRYYAGSYKGWGLGVYRIKSDNSEEFKELLSVETDWNGYEAVVANAQIKAVAGEITNLKNTSAVEFLGGHSIYKSASELVVAANMKMMLAVNNTSALYIDGIAAMMYARLPIDMGGHSIHNTVIKNSSDRRLKANIENSNISALEKIRSANFVEFDWKDPNYPQKRQYGLIAQDTPWLVDNQNDAYLSINTSKQIMYNTRAIQELDSNINTVAQQLNTVSKERLQHTLLLESKLLSLENTVLQLQQEIEQLRAA